MLQLINAKESRVCFLQANGEFLKLLCSLFGEKLSNKLESNIMCETAESEKKTNIFKFTVKPLRLHLCCL